MKDFRKKTGKSFGGSKILLIFAASNHNSGMKTAGITSSLFCVHTYRINGITTPSRESGQRPGVSARMDLTARSVVYLLSNYTCYETEDLFVRNWMLAADGRHVPGAHHRPRVGVHGCETGTESRVIAYSKGCGMPRRLVVFGEPVADHSLRHRVGGGVHAWRRGEGACVLGGHRLADGDSGMNM